jgi:hypothetical protein
VGKIKSKFLGFKRFREIPFNSLSLSMQFNGFHTLSLTGLGFSIFAHALLVLVNKSVENYWLVYPTWALVFIFGFIWNLIDKGEEHHH